jgi:hypothetical protein
LKLFFVLAWIYKCQIIRPQVFQDDLPVIVKPPLEQEILCNSSTVAMTVRAMGAISNFLQILKTKTRLLIHCPPKSNPKPNPKEDQRKSHPENADNQPPRMTMKMIIQNKTNFLPMIQTHQTHQTLQTLQTQTVMQMQEKKTILPVVVVRVSA